MVGNGQKPNPKPRALILSGFGINCDRETAYAFECAGAVAVPMHLNELIAEPDRLREFQIFVVPGGFSFGDDVASGRILANRLRYRLGAPLLRFVDDGNLVLGICNGFQVLVKMGLLPGTDNGLLQTATLTHNDSDRFEDRWVHLAVDPNTQCPWLDGIDRLELPIRHGEGKFMMADDLALNAFEGSGQAVLHYARRNGECANGAYPANPNGSQRDIAGICDNTGRVFGLMPHPEAFIVHTQHPRWTRENIAPEGQGLAIFRNGVQHAKRLSIAQSA